MDTNQERPLLAQVQYILNQSLINFNFTGIFYSTYLWAFCVSDFLLFLDSKFLFKTLLSMKLICKFILLKLSAVFHEINSNCWIWLFFDISTFKTKFNKILSPNLEESLDISYPGCLSLILSKLAIKNLVALCQFLPWVNLVNGALYKDNIVGKPPISGIFVISKSTIYDHAFRLSAVLWSKTFRFQKMFHNRKLDLRPIGVSILSRWEGLFVVFRLVSANAFHQNLSGFEPRCRHSFSLHQILQSMPNAW